MCPWILTANGSIIPRMTIRPLTIIECYRNIEKRKQLIFLKAIESKLGTSINPEATTDTKSEFIPYEDNEKLPQIILDINVQINDNRVNTQPVYNKLINIEVTLQRRDILECGKIKGRSLVPDGSIIGTYNDNLILNTLYYDVEFPDS